MATPSKRKSAVRGLSPAQRTNHPPFSLSDLRLASLIALRAASLWDETAGLPNASVAVKAHYLDFLAGFVGSALFHEARLPVASTEGYVVRAEDATLLATHQLVVDVLKRFQHGPDRGMRDVALGRLWMTVLPLSEAAAGKIRFHWKKFQEGAVAAGKADWISALGGPNEAAASLLEVLAICGKTRLRALRRAMKTKGSTDAVLLHKKIEGLARGAIGHTAPADAVVRYGMTVLGFTEPEIDLALLERARRRNR